jgi:hypothetical protein
MHKKSICKYTAWNGDGMETNETISDRYRAPAVCTENLNPEVVVMESAEDGERF